MNRLLWVVEKQFDVAPDTATWLEMTSHLKDNYEVRLLTGYRHNKVLSDYNGNEIWHYKSARIPALNRIMRTVTLPASFLAAVQSFQPFVVVLNCHNPFLIRYATSLRKKRKFKLIMDVRSIPVPASRIRRYIKEEIFCLNLRYAAKYFDGVTYITREMRRYCTSKYNLLPHDSAIWTSGVNPGLFYHGPSDPANDPMRIMYHGSVAKKRRLDNAVKAVGLLRDIDVCLEILGGGDALPDLKDLVKTLGLEHRVTFRNSISYRDVPRWINSGHVGILPFPAWPGWNVSSPIKLFEYLSCGKPVIVTDIPAHRNVVEGRSFAFWAGDGSPDAIACAMRRAYEQRSNFDALGKQAREFIMKEYTWERQAERLTAFVGSITTLESVA